jgi:hypothetical protein
VWGANIESDFVVELAHSEFVKLLAGQADTAEVGGTIDLMAQVK